MFLWRSGWQFDSKAVRLGSKPKVTINSIVFVVFDVPKFGLITII